MDNNLLIENQEEEKIRYKDSTYDIVSKIAYLIGVHKKNFENENEPPKLEVYEELQRDKNARIIRNLCILRTTIERGFVHIQNKIKFEYKSIYSMPDYIPQHTLSELEADGIMFGKKTHTHLNQYVIELNRLISDRINNCKSLFPVWLNWEYIKDLFIIPNGLTEDGVRATVEVYYANINSYPYKALINWKPRTNGNILFNDKKFVTLLYDVHDDTFTEYNRVSDVGNYVKGGIYNFIQEANNIVMIVDCENSDPYRLCSVLVGLCKEKLSKISQIILVDGTHTVDAWKILESYTDIPVDYILTERVMQRKSLVDIELTARTCKEHYKNNVDSFIIVSSDSDYWGLINSLEDAKFMLMVEKQKCGTDMKNTLMEHDIFYCFIDDFYAGNSDDIKTKALCKDLSKRLRDEVSFNINDLYKQSLIHTRIEMSDAGKKQFFDKYIKRMSLQVDEDGNVTVSLQSK